MSDVRQGGGFADRDSDVLAVEPDYRDTSREEGDERAVDETVAAASPATPSGARPGLIGQEDARPVRLGGMDAGDRAAAAASATTNGVSDVAAKNTRRWGMMLAVGAASLGLASVFLWNAFATKKGQTPPVPAGPVASRLADLMEAPRPNLAPVPIQQAMVRPEQPKKTPAEELAEKAQRAPLMAATPNAGALQPAGRAVGTSNEARSREALGARGDGFAQGASGIARVKAYSLGDATFRLSAGTPIPCVLDTAMDTTIAGMVRCHLEHDVLSANQTVVLLDAGTNIVGEYQANLKQGQERIGIVWMRAETPNSIAVDLQSQGVDPLGRAGVDGEVETYFWTRFGAALMFSLVTDAGQVARSWAQSQLQQGNGSNTYVFGNVGGNTQQGLNQNMAELIRQAGAIPPVLKKNQGERVYISLRRDLDFSGVYGLERR